MIEIPFFAQKKDLFKFLKDNKSQLEAQKKATVKQADGYYFNNTFFDQKSGAVKANMPLTDLNPADEYKVRAIINTTNWLDSHSDVHLPGIWDKSLNENKMIMHVQEHEMYKFSAIISEGDDLKAYTKSYTWKELGFNYPGKTEALVFDSIIKRKGQKPRNEYMYEQYTKGYVKNHSVGMRYIKMVLCINEPDDEYYSAEFEAWEKYFPEVVNQDAALEKGYFWAIKEAKAIEGSAVPRGSNIVTPTLNNNLKGEPGNHSLSEPPKGTQSKGINFNYLAENFKLN